MDGEAFEHFLDDATLLDPAAPVEPTLIAFRERGLAAGRLMVPLARLAEVAAIDAPDGEERLAVAAVAPRTLVPEDWEDMLEDAADRLNEFVKADRGYELEAFEARVPDLKDLEGYLQDLEGFGDAEIFVELPDHDGVGEAVAFFAEGEGAVAAAFPVDGSRTGEFVAACLSLDVPFKLLGVDDPARTLAAVGVAMAEDLASAEIALALRDGPSRPATSEEEDDARELLMSVA